MHEAARVQRLERSGDVVDGARPALEGAAAHLPEVAALEVLHDEEQSGLRALQAVDRDGQPGRQRRRSATSDSSRARRAASPVTDSSKNLSATSLAALAISGEPDLGAAAAADPSHQHEPGAEFEPGVSAPAWGVNPRRSIAQQASWSPRRATGAPPARVRSLPCRAHAAGGAIPRTALPPCPVRRSARPSTSTTSGAASVEKLPEISFSDSAWIFASSRFL